MIATQKLTSRELALQVIQEVNVSGAYSNIALAKAINNNELSDLDRRFLTELVYGTLKAGRTLEWIIEQYSSRPMSKIPQVIRMILQIGAFQLFFLSKVPPSAAVNESVNMTKKYGHPGTVSFVNAVLRSAVRQPERIVYPNLGKNPVEHISLKYMHPSWLVKRWMKQIGIQATIAFCEFNNSTPPLSLRTNVTKINREKLLEVLAEEGIIAESSLLVPEGILCSHIPALSRLKSLQEGCFQVQDESSMLVAHVLDPKPAEFVIDACSAPGGKTTHIAEMMQNQGRVLAVDIYEHKLGLIKQNAQRLGLGVIETRLGDAALLGEEFAGLADRVLVDAPCSGLGVLRRKPDARWRKTMEHIKHFPALQLKLLIGAAACVKPGGVLVYSTCTTEDAENTGVINSFLAAHPEFSVEHAGQLLPVPRSEQMIHLWPHVDGTDGFFITRMIRKTG